MKDCFLPRNIGAITQGNMTFAAWRTVFLLATAIYIVGNIVYVAFISGDVQPWNSPDEGDRSDAEGGEDDKDIVELEI